MPVAAVSRLQLLTDQLSDRTGQCLQTDAAAAADPMAPAGSAAAATVAAGAAAADATVSTNTPAPGLHGLTAAERFFFEINGPAVCATIASKLAALAAVQ